MREILGKWIPCIWYVLLLKLLNLVFTATKVWNLLKNGFLTISSQGWTYCFMLFVQETSSTVCLVWGFAKCNIFIFSQFFHISFVEIEWYGHWITFYFTGWKKLKLLYHLLLLKSLRQVFSACSMQLSSRTVSDFMQDHQYWIRSSRWGLARPLKQ